MTNSGIKIMGIDAGILLIILSALLLLAIILLIVFIILHFKLKKRLDAFMIGKDGASLEDDIADLFDINKQIAEKVKENRKDIRKLYKKLTKAFQKFGIVKYDAYQQMGGMLSFSMAMLDEDNDGFILNSVHSTDGCYTYTKEIREGECEIDLGNEEKVALDRAMNAKD